MKKFALAIAAFAAAMFIFAPACSSSDYSVEYLDITSSERLASSSSYDYRYEVGYRIDFYVNGGAVYQICLNINAFNARGSVVDTEVVYIDDLFNHRSDIYSYRDSAIVEFNSSFEPDRFNVALIEVSTVATNDWVPIVSGCVAGGAVAATVVLFVLGVVKDKKKKRAGSSPSEDEGAGREENGGE